MTDEAPLRAPQATADRIAAWALIAIPVLEIAAMAHHPSITSREPVQIVTQLRALAALDARVHAILIALIFAALFALAQFAAARGLGRAAVRTGLLAYAAGVMIMTPAGLVDGFIVPRVALVLPGIAPAAPDLLAQFAAFAMLFNQAFASCGAVLMSVGIAAFSLELLRAAPRGTRALGVFGLASGLGCALAVGSGWLRLDLHGMSAVLLLQALWTLGAGVVLLRQPASHQPMP
jgi:hypothetical protein